MDLQQFLVGMDSQFLTLSLICSDLPVDSSDLRVLQGFFGKTRRNNLSFMHHGKAVNDVYQF
jgi:hypothetical protein